MDRGAVTENPAKNGQKPFGKRGCFQERAVVTITYDMVDRASACSCLTVCADYLNDVPGVEIPRPASDKAGERRGHPSSDSPKSFHVLRDVAYTHNRSYCLLHRVFLLLQQRWTFPIEETVVTRLLRIGHKDCQPATTGARASARTQCWRTFEYYEMTMNFRGVCLREFDNKWHLVRGFSVAHHVRRGSTTNLNR